jgi:hypothetical protein
LSEDDLIERAAVELIEAWGDPGSWAGLSYDELVSAVSFMAWPRPDGEVIEQSSENLRKLASAIWRRRPDR